MKVAATSVEQLHEGGCRLDASYHASEGVKALHFIQKWADQPAQVPVPASRVLRDSAMAYGDRRLDALKEVCMPEGIFIPGRFKRIYVDDPDHGEPWLSPSDMLKADLSNLRLISRKYTPSIESLRVHQGWLLLSRSGTVGNLAYVREDMDGMVGSDDIIRIVADPDKISPGYLYAFLSSPLGRALIEQKTYGAVVPHIEAHHVIDLPIPRLDSIVEERIHQLVEQATSLRAEASEFITEMRKDLLRENGLSNLIPRDYYFYGSTRSDRGPGTFVVTSSRISSLSINAWNYGDKFQAMKRRITEGRRHSPLREVLKPGGYYKGSSYKRIPISKGYGIELLTQKQMFNLRKEGNWISLVPIADVDSEKIKDGTILIAGVGTMGETEVFGRCEFAWKNFENKLVVAEVIRVVPDPDYIDPGYLFTYLSSDYGFRLLRSTISGTKLCRFIEPLVFGIPVPLATSDIQKAIGDKIRQAYGKRASALALEDESRRLLTEALEADEQRHILPLYRAGIV